MPCSTSASIRLRAKRSVDLPPEVMDNPIHTVLGRNVAKGRLSLSAEPNASRRCKAAT